MLNRQTVAQMWDLFGRAEVDLFVSQESSQCPLWFSLSSPAPLGIDAFAHPWPNLRTVCISTCQADSSSPVQGEGERCPSPARSPVFGHARWFSELISLLELLPWEIPIREDLLSQLQGKIWHPEPQIWKLWVWPINGHQLLVFLQMFRRPLLVP